MRVAETAAAEPPCAKVPHSPEAGVSADRSLLFDLIKNGHGSFARFARIYRSVEAGVCTPSEPTGTTTLFPSMLPWKNPRVSLSMGEASNLPSSGRLWNGCAYFGACSIFLKQVLLAVRMQQAQPFLVHR